MQLRISRKPRQVILRFAINFKVLLFVLPRHWRHIFDPMTMAKCSLSVFLNLQDSDWLTEDEGNTKAKQVQVNWCTVRS